MSHRAIIHLNDLHPDPGVVREKFSTLPYDVVVITDHENKHRTWIIQIDDKDFDAKEFMTIIMDHMWVDSIEVDSQVRQKRNANGMSIWALVTRAAELIGSDPEFLIDYNRIVTWPLNGMVFKFGDHGDVSKTILVVYNLNRDEWMCQDDSARGYSFRHPTDRVDSCRIDVHHHDD